MREDDWLVSLDAYAVHRPDPEDGTALPVGNDSAAGIDAQRLTTDLEKRLREGPGFAVVRGVDLAALSDEECAQVCRHLAGLVGAVRPHEPERRSDELVTAAEQARTLADGSRDTGDQALFLHSDRSSHQQPPRVLALLCIRPALSGGDSLLVSGPAVHNRLLESAPESLAQLYGNFHFGRGEGFDRVFPVFHRSSSGTVRVLYNRYHIECAHQEAGRPLSARQTAALDAFDEVLSEPRMTVQVSLRRGDLLLLANTTTLHGRTAFTDPDDPSQARCLARAWAD